MQNCPPALMGIFIDLKYTRSALKTCSARNRLRLNLDSAQELRRLEAGIKRLHFVSNLQNSFIEALVMMCRIHQRFLKIKTKKRTLSCPLYFKINCDRSYSELDRFTYGSACVRFTAAGFRFPM